MIPNLDENVYIMLMVPGMQTLANSHATSELTDENQRKESNDKVFHDDNQLPGAVVGLCNIRCINDHEKSQKTSLPIERCFQVTREASRKVAGKKLLQVSKKCTSRIGFRVLDVLMAIALFLVLLIHQSLLSIESFGFKYWIPWMERHLEWDRDRKARSGTYYNRVCNTLDRTIFNKSELVVDTRTDEIDSNSRIDTYKRSINRHGLQILPSLLSVETASELRDFVIKQNYKNQNTIGVIEQENRWSFYLQVDQHPSVAKAVHELLTNTLLLDIFESAFGTRDPSVMELVVLTSAEGAVDQHWHFDVMSDASATKYARNFFQFYSLFVPLQDTTSEMGATGVCPGSHMCYDIDEDETEQYYNETCFQVSSVFEDDNGRNGVWPTGWGALVNTRLLHKGSAHTSGPHRVLFIPSLAPRKLLNGNEHRTFPQGGVYGMYWAQWGLTVSDFVYWSKNVIQYPPQRFLSWIYMFRSFGLLQSHSWNFWDQVSSRIANNAVGYSPRQLAMHFKNAFPWFPSMLLGKAVSAKEYNSKFETDVILSFLHDTAQRILSTTGYMQWFLLFAMLCFRVQKNAWGKRSPKNVLALLLRWFGIKFLVIISFGLMIQKITKSRWANSIRSERLWNEPIEVSDPLLTNLNLVEGDIADHFPEALPLSEDILMSNHLQSEYFGSYNQIIDHYHPGNQYWEDVIVPHYANGFTTASPSIQNAICTSVLQALETEFRRILIHNSVGNWAIPSKSHMLHFCHKSLTMQSSSDTRRKIIKQIDFLIAETQFGYWRNTVLHSTIVPIKLISLQDKILRYDTTKSKFRKELERSTNSPSPFFNSVSRQLPIVPSGRTPTMILQQRWRSYSTSLGAQPYPEAWILQGDLVEVYNKDNDNGLCWYPGLVIAANAEEYEYEVKKMGEDEIKEHPYVRRYKRFEIGDMVEVLVSSNDDEENEDSENEEEAYYPARVVGMVKNKKSFIRVVFDGYSDPSIVPKLSIRRDCNYMNHENLKME